VECLIGFVAETMLQSIKRATDDQIAQWYYEVSLSLVGCRHELTRTCVALANLRQESTLRVESRKATQEGQEARKPCTVIKQHAR
jgi:hypothetical protein